MPDEREYVIRISGSLSREGFDLARASLQGLKSETDRTTTSGKGLEDQHRRTSDEAKKHAGFTDTLRGQLQGLVSGHDGLIPRVRDLALGYVTGQAALSAFTTAGRFAIGFMKDSIGEAIEADTATRKLVATLRDQGTAVPVVLDHFDQLAQKYQDTTRFSADCIKEQQSLLVQVGGVLPAEMDKALQATTNLAIKTGDLGAAATIVGKVYAGELAPC